jgi:spermidine synthase
MWPGQAQSLAVDEVVWDKKSEFQDVLVMKTKAWGTVFCLDGAIQVTDLDECSYHENMAHIPCCAHRTGPKDVLIIGGGDGGVMREVLRHPTVQSVTLVDIDGMVPEIAKKFYPKLACSFDDPRAKPIVGDGFAFMEGKVEEFDVVIVDSSDPEGPASTLFGKEFYERCRKALRPGGILVTQGENIWLHLKLIKDMYEFIKTVGFKSVEYTVIQMPSYPNGSIGFFVCTDDGPCNAPRRSLPAEEAEKLRYYDEQMHHAAFALPLFARRELARKV